MMLQFSPDVIQIIAACFVQHKFVILNRFLCWLQIKTSFVSSYQQPYILCLYSLKFLHLLTLERCEQLIFISWCNLVCLFRDWYTLLYMFFSMLKKYLAICKFVWNWRPQRLYYVFSRYLSICYITFSVTWVVKDFHPGGFAPVKVYPCQIAPITTSLPHQL